MTEKFPVVYLCRHGQTEWSKSGQHTGLTDLPLTADGETAARKLGERLRDLKFARVFTSPLQRAKRTCELAGFADATLDADLVEWNYGLYEGRTSDDIHRKVPNWHLFEDGCPEGESVADVLARADRVVQRVRAIDADVLLFSSGHFLRMLVARWLGLAPTAGACFHLDTASTSILGYEHSKDEPVVRLWNSCG